MTTGFRRNTSPRLAAFLRLLAASGLLASLTACGVAVTDGEQQRSLDGVKLISASISDANDPTAFTQSKYQLDANDRLLIRYESFMKVEPQVRAEDGHKVQIQIAPDNPSDMTTLTQSLKVCPVQRNWMMAATWTRAHPFSHEGVWSKPGGDFDPTECVASGGPDATGSFAVFDVTPWFLNYVRGRNENFGLIAVASAPITIAGDTSGSFSPRLLWTTTEEYPPVAPTPSTFPQASATPTPTK